MGILSIFISFSMFLDIIYYMVIVNKILKCISATPVRSTIKQTKVVTKKCVNRDLNPNHGIDSLCPKHYATRPVGYSQYY